MKKISVLIIITLITTVLFASEFKIGQKVYVTVNKLNFRSSPSVNGELAGQFLLAQELIIVQKGDQKEQIDGKYDYWYQVKRSDKTGWVFGSFISDQKALNKAQLAAKFSGTYYYYKIWEKNNYTRILKIAKYKFIERRYNESTGITDEIKGDVVYQDDSIILIAKTRKVRPSVYINYPREGTERQAYANAYFGWTDDPSYLKSLPRFKADKKPNKLYIKHSEQKDVYLVDEDKPLSNLEYGYQKKK